MMRHRSLVVLAVFAALALLPAPASASGPFDCPDSSPASFLGTPAPAAGEGLFSPADVGLLKDRHNPLALNSHAAQVL